MNNNDNIPQADFSFVRYANCWEDSTLLIKALCPTRGKRLLSIASAGDNSLSLIASGAEVVAVDLNPAQLACAELRKESIRALEYSDFLKFAGTDISNARLETYTAIRPALGRAAQAYWDARTEIISAGFIHSGKFERYFQIFRRSVLPLIHSPRTLQELLKPKSLQARRDFYRDTWNNRRWNLLFRFFFSRTMMGRLGRDPAFFNHVQGRVSSRILQRAHYALTELDTSKNPYLSYILTGNFKPELPHYLQPENYRAIRQQIDHLTLRQGAVDAIAEEYGDCSFDGYNLSDIFEYLSSEQCAEVYGRLLKSARPKARLAYWNMLVPRQCPSSLASRICPLEREAQELFLEDRAFFYSRFVLEEVK